ncbi:oxidoreductase [Coniochaeta sp. 2T2.1]|nr:oxidoreductase [Coniochaeta sp. 2T2.1]
MASSTPFPLKWGIMATGWIAEMFVQDLLTNPAVRDVHDIRHQLFAVASSTNASRAADFVKKVKGPEGVKTYGSYRELVADPDVDIVYVATPHSHHFQNAMLALQAGKNVLCEKALTVNASQARKLVQVAKEKNLFFMEAVWTRYFPLSIKVRELIQSGTIGPVYRVIADLSFNKDLPNGKVDYDDSHRLVNLDLAGGALLDLGIYSLTWLFQTMYHLQPEAEKEAPKVVAAVNKYFTGADEMTSMILQFPKHKSMGIGLTALRVGTDVDGLNTGGPAIRIQGSGGEIQVMGPAYRPLQYKVIRKSEPGKVEVVDCPIPHDKERDWGHGMFWEADECARCIRDGKKESATLPWSESIVIMETMEEVLKQAAPDSSAAPITSQASANPDLYEATHVHKVYSQIAPHFSLTRHKPWPLVASFLSSQPPGALGFDVGCGNGKYLSVNRDVYLIGSDRSAELVGLARDGRDLDPDVRAVGEGKREVVTADGLALPFPEGRADFVVCIAVLHHFSTKERRVAGVGELLRLVRRRRGKEGEEERGKVMVFVWALEQGGSRRGWDEGAEQDQLVPWVMKGPQVKKKKKEKKVRGGGEEEGEVETEEKKLEEKTFNRYYHLYRKGELEQDVEAAGGLVLESGYDRDNWWVIAANVAS